LVATPIGNLGDIGARALEWLRSADLIACEDTRVTGKLLRHFGIDRPLAPYHEHNAERARPKILERLAQGERVALVSDAGTPLVSDPGYKLVAAAIAAGFDIAALPGPSAILAALVLSGLPSDRFLFVGFLPSKTTARRRELDEIKNVRATLVLFEAAPRLAASLSDMAAVLGDRKAAILREMTKLFEEARRGSLRELARHYSASAQPKGEIVVVIGPPEERAPDAGALDEFLTEALTRSSLKDAVAEVATALGLPRRQVYERALAIARGETR
jgi:16S rRNA (cytidine1402-2'-O)-methyltransferase